MLWAQCARLEFKWSLFSSPQLQTTPLAGLTEHVGPVMTLRRCVLPLWATVHLLHLHHSDALVSHGACSPPDPALRYASLGKPHILTDSLSGPLLGNYFEIFSCNDRRYLQDLQGSLQPWGTWFPLTWMRAGGRWLQVSLGVIYQCASHDLKTLNLKTLNKVISVIFAEVSVLITTAITGEAQF